MKNVQKLLIILALAVCGQVFAEEEVSVEQDSVAAEQPEFSLVEQEADNDADVVLENEQVEDAADEVDSEESQDLDELLNSLQKELENQNTAE